MNEVYRHVQLAPDDYLGRVDAEGKVFETRFGPDRYIGHVDMDTGHIFEARLGPDKLIGHVKHQTGKVFQQRIGPDAYLGRVQKNGHCYMHQSFTRRKYLGKIRNLTSLVCGGAGFLLLLYPAMIETEEEEQNLKDSDAPADPSNAGMAPAGH